MHPAKLVAMVVLCYGFGAIYESNSKLTLSALPLPWLVATLQMGVGMIYIFPLWAMGLRHPPKLSDIQKKEVFPLSLLHAGGHLLSTGILGASALGISIIFKAMEPALVALALRVLDGNAEHFVVILSLLPLMAGVFITFFEAVACTWFVVAMSAGMIVCYVHLSVFAKKVMGELGMPRGGDLYGIIAMMAFLSIIPFTMIMEGAQVASGWERAVASVGESTLVKGLIVGGMGLYLSNELAFSILSELGPLATAVALVVKPVAILAASGVFFGSDMPLGSGAGILLTGLGVVLYVTAKSKYMLKPIRTIKQ